MSKTLTKAQNYSQLFQDNKNQNVETCYTQQFQPPASIKRLFEDQKFTSAFYKDHVQQQYAIQRAFKSNNFTYLRNLPENFKYGQILGDRKDKVKKLSNQQMTKRGLPFDQKFQNRKQKAKQLKKQQIGTLGYFNIFPYEQSNYQMPKLLNNIQRMQNQKKRKQISSLEFRPSGVQSKMKYQDPFQYIDKVTGQVKNQNGQYIFPFHLPHDTYDCFHESQLRRKIIHDTMKLNGDFLPANKQYTLTKANRQNFGQIVKQIQLFLKKYLKQIGFFIGVGPNQNIDVLFEQKFKQNNKIYMIMSKICQHQTLCKFVLRRNLQKWGIMDNQKGYIIFSILPYWVKNPVQSLKK